METHVPTRKTCQRLQELGVKLDTEFVWERNGAGWKIKKNTMNRDGDKLTSPAPLLSELLEIYRKSDIDLQMKTEGDSVFARVVDEDEVIRTDYYADGFVWGSPEPPENMDDLVAKLLIWPIENDHVNLEEL